MKISISVQASTLEEAQGILERLYGVVPAEKPAQKFLNRIPYNSYGLDDAKIRVGKYKDRYSARELLERDPQYVVWSAENMDNPIGSEELRKIAHELVNTGEAHDNPPVESEIRLPIAALGGRLHLEPEPVGSEAHRMTPLTAADYDDSIPF